MKAAVYSGPGAIGVKERTVPEPDPGWVRIGVTVAGICGSDLHIYHAAMGNPRGMQPGHEVAGVIDAVGDGCRIETGLHVAVEPILGCGSCHSCGTGRSNLCAETKLFGIALPGGLAEFVTVPENLLHILPGNLNQRAAGLSEPLAVCVRGARIGGISVGDRVAIIGAGTIGLLSILTAKEAGASDVLITARHPHQQELARSLGADRVYPDSKALLADVGDQFVDVVVETVSGETETLTESVLVARTGGRISLLGVFTGNPKLPGMPFFSKELTLKASNCYSREDDQGDFAIGAALAAKHAGLIEPLVTHTFSLDEIGRAFATADDKSQRTIKVQIRPGAQAS